MVATVQELLDIPAGKADEETRAVEAARKKLRLIVLGVPHWQP
jgi:hypothetical protein